MFRNQVKYVLGRIKNKIRRDMTELEMRYIATQVKNAKVPSMDKDLLEIVVREVHKHLLNPHLISPALAEPHSMDMHELLKKQLNSENKKEPAPDRKVSHHNIYSIFGTRDSYKLTKVFNPRALIGYSYIILDRRYHTRLNNNYDKFTWNFAPQTSGINTSTTITTNAPVQNIVGIEILPFRLPRSENAVLSSSRISVLIDELATQSFTSSEEGKRFHFLFKTSAPASAYEQLVLQDLTGENTEFNFYKPIKQQISSLTVSFGNPFRPLIFDPDILPATISASGVETLLTFSQPHYLNVGDYVICSTFTTTSPGVDSVEISQLNDKDGWAIASLTSTTATISVDISGLSGTISGNPHNIYLESKRFVIPLIIKFIKPPEA